MLYIIGINHGYQFIGEHYPSLNSLINIWTLPPETQQYQLPFCEYLINFISEKNIDSVFEECIENGVEKSIANKLAEVNKIRYEQIDPFPQPKDSNGKVDDELRERIWLTKICEYYLKSKNVLIIIGSNHCDSFKNKLLDKSHDVEMVDERELKSRLIPKNYNDIILKV